MSAPFTDQYDKKYLLQNMMGPNAMRITEELTSSLAISEKSRILDLGCGMGISSIVLAKKYGATVFAADLWISPTDNAERFAALGLDDAIIPLSIDATREIPFAHGYFDMVVSVDSYQYYGGNETMLPKLLPFVKKGGTVAIAVPGFNQDFPEGKFPPEIQPFWTPEWYFYSCAWWRELWEKEPGIAIVEAKEMACCQQAWEEWLVAENPHAESDRKMMDAGAGKYFSLIQLVGRKV